MIKMYDSINLPAVRRVASTHNDAVAGYVDGRWPDFHAMAAAFPNDHHLSIATNPARDADCLDVEAGDATPDQAPEWAIRQHRRGVWRPVIYANAATYPKIEEAFRKAGLPGVFIRRWVADWNGQADIPQGFDGHQFTNHADGLSVDESVLLDDFFGAKHHLARVRLHLDAQVDLRDLGWSIVGHGVQPLGWGD